MLRQAMPVLTAMMTSELNTPGLEQAKIGQRFRFMASFRVIEKTKNYCILEIKNISIIKSKRVF